MATWCLVRDQADKFIKGLRSGEIDPIKMASMTSEERHSYLAKFVGSENAKQVNSLFESKLLLKNQQQGMITWAKKVGGLSKETRNDLITRIGKLDRVLNPEDQKSFLKDLASTKIGTDITAKEAKSIFDLSNKVKEASQVMKEDSTFETRAEGLAYGHAKVDLVNYINELKGNDKFTLKQAMDIAGLSKSIQASMDNSSIFRQGWKTLFTHPLTWQKNARQTFVDIVKEFGGKGVMDEVHADMFSRKNELNGNYKKMGLAITRPEEAYPTTLPEKIPVLGRAYKASEVAYTGFVYRQRMDIADKYLQIAEKSGTKMTDQEYKAIGSMVNSLTGRGNLGKWEGSGADALNSVFFSPRNIKSQFDTLGHVVTGAGGSNFVRKEAAINLVKVVSGIATIITIANAVKPGSAETDPRSSDFGKIRVGDTRFDITGGMGSLVTLASRLAPILAGQKGYSKSSTTGKLTEINAKDKSGNPAFGAKTGKDVAVDYLTNKVSPVGRLVIDLLNQTDFNGKPITPLGEATKFVTPLSVSTYQELKDNPNSANIVLAMIADGLGISTNTYSAKPPKPPKQSTANVKRTVNRGVSRAQVK